MDLTVVVPAYDEARSLPVLYERLRDALAPLGLAWEVVFVDDGSVDDTFAAVHALRKADERVHGLRLSRNFGHQLALLAGLRAARGRAVVTMDADLEYPPELIPDLVRRWREGALIVNTVRSGPEPDRSLFKRLTSRAFYWVFRKLSGLDLGPGRADFRLFDRTVVDLVVASNDPRPFFRGFAAWVGFTQAHVPFTPGRRLHGTSRYTLRKMLRLALSGVVGYSATPLYWSLGIGVVGLAFSLGYAAYALVAHYLLRNTLPGWTSVVVLVSILMSLQFVMLGVLGVYVAEVAASVRGRPSVVVAESTLEPRPAERA